MSLPIKPTPKITVGISPSAVQGVAIAAYSGRHSRMWSWDAVSLEVLGYQDVKARVMLRDVSSSGEFCAYYAEAYSKREHYVAIAKPPYFHALWLRNQSEIAVHAVLFENSNLVAHCVSPKKQEHPWSRIIEERTTEGSPFRFEEIRSDHQEHCDLFAYRCSGILEYTDHWRWQTPAFPNWVGKDPRGRSITVRGSQILADGVPFLDCQRLQFETVSTPSWAKKWGGHNPALKKV